MVYQAIDLSLEEIPEISFSNYDIKREIEVPKKLTTELAYLCGILAGDGHISKDDKDGGVRYSISCGGNPKDEKEFYDINIKRLMKELFNVNINPKDLGDGTYGFRYESKGIVQFLTKIICLPRGKKYKSIKIPEIFLEDKDMILSFVQGLFDTDFGLCLTRRKGSEPYYPQICFDSKSESFTKEVWQALKSFGLEFKGKVYMVYDEDPRAKAGYTITYRFDMYGHRYFVDILKIIRLRHPKHIKKYQEWLEANKNNKKVIKLIAGEGFEPSTFGSLK